MVTVEGLALGMFSGVVLFAWTHDRIAAWWEARHDAARQSLPPVTFPQPPDPAECGTAARECGTRD
jgi:hypothetical protein